MKRLASWNVNGIRACVKKGFWDWFEEEEKHIIGLQETKASPDQLDEKFNDIPNYFSYYANAKKKGYSGVALYTHKKLGEPVVTIGLGIDEFDDEGRTIIAEFSDLIVINGYFPNGQRDHNRVPYKLNYSRAVAEKALQLKDETGKEVVIMGDYNTAHTEIDLANPKTNKKTTGFLPIEREWMDEFVEQGFVDIFRTKHPDENGHYTWWTYRGDCRARNIGWRIDYFFITNELVKSVIKAFNRPDVMGSDHCPIYLELK